MRRLIHLSDLHFGTLEANTLDPLVNFVTESKCDLVVISGDLTQRARVSQFEAARDFLKKLLVKQIIVPGNHDIPLYHLWLRFVRPFRNFSNFINSDLESTYVDHEIAILGMNTVSLWKIEGAFDTHRISHLMRRFQSLPQKLVKILVTHHKVPEDILVRSGLNFDLLLSGHTHQASAELRPSGPHHTNIVVEAGTTTSTRVRNGHKNSFNIIDINKGKVNIQRFEWTPEKSLFEAQKMAQFLLGDRGWVKA